MSLDLDKELTPMDPADDKLIKLAEKEILKKDTIKNIKETLTSRLSMNYLKLSATYNLATPKEIIDNYIKDMPKNYKIKIDYNDFKLDILNGGMIIAGDVLAKGVFSFYELKYNGYADDFDLFNIYYGDSGDGKFREQIRTPLKAASSLDECIEALVNENSGRESFLQKSVLKCEQDYFEFITPKAVHFIHQIPEK